MRRLNLKRSLQSKMFINQRQWNKLILNCLWTKRTSTTKKRQNSSKNFQKRPLLKSITTLTSTKRSLWNLTTAISMLRGSRMDTWWGSMTWRTPSREWSGKLIRILLIFWRDSLWLKLNSSNLRMMWRSKLTVEWRKWGSRPRAYSSNSWRSLKSHPFRIMKAYKGIRKPLKSSSCKYSWCRRIWISSRAKSWGDGPSPILKVSWMKVRIQVESLRIIWIAGSLK